MSKKSPFSVNLLFYTFLPLLNCLSSASFMPSLPAQQHPSKSLPLFITSLLQPHLQYYKQWLTIMDGNTHVWLVMKLRMFIKWEIKAMRPMTVWN